jgi:hypothetical protein
MTRAQAPASDDALRQEVTLLELLDRVLDKGVVLTGDITLSVADVDLVYVGLRVLLSSVETARRQRAPRLEEPSPPPSAPTPNRTTPQPSSAPR